MNFKGNPFDGNLEIIATLADDAIMASIRELGHQDNLTLAIKQALKQGADINDVSSASGLPVAEIKRRMARDLQMDEDLAELAGLR